MKYPDSEEGPQLVTGEGESASTPTLSDVGVDLTDLAMRLELDPVHGRDEEVKSALRTLVRRRKNNPCLMGEPGVGKRMTIGLFAYSTTYSTYSSHFLTTTGKTATRGRRAESKASKRGRIC